MKLRVVYTLPSGSSEDSGVTSSANRSFRLGTDDLSVRLASFIIYVGNIRFANKILVQRLIFVRLFTLYLADAEECKP